jgi:hypothetical protein
VTAGATRGKRPRWGLRTLGFLAVAAASLLAYDWFSANGLALLTSVGLLLGLVGAAICSVRGIRASRRPLSP